MMHSSKRDANYLPRHIARSFQHDLITTIGSLSPPEGGSPSLDFKYRYLKEEYLSKYCDLSTTPAPVRRQAAIEKWLKTEQRNRKTNIRLMFDTCDFGWCNSEEIQSFAKNLITRVLGHLQYDTIFTDGGFTNGASTRVKRTKHAAIQKCTGRAHVSSTALAHWLSCAEGTRLPHDLEICEASELFTVPKKEDIDRVACKEPDLNMYLQRSVGQHIRRRLRRFGVDLNDQTINQRLARRAVADGLATIDLSAASDSISHQLVLNLLPFEWYALLDDIRVRETRIDGAIHELEMFSSMGNGFTFELESLIFWALTRAVCYYSGVKGKISVYGDDIIAPARVTPRLARVFSWFGFTINLKKSAWTGSFRESCGKHYHGSLDITPFYLREPVKKKTDVIRVLNRVLAWEGNLITDPALVSFHKRWSGVIPQSVWGGQSTDDISSLVTGHAPRKRIIPRTRGRRSKNTLTGFIKDFSVYDQVGGLVHWLDQKRKCLEVIDLDTLWEQGSKLVPNPRRTVSAAWDIYLE